MILVALAGLCALSVVVSGGSLARLADVRVRGLWVPLLALGLQVLITELAPGGDAAIHRGLHIASYALIGVFLWCNRRLPAMGVTALGAALNALAITVNGGVMPASASAERISGLRIARGFDNSAPVAHPHLAWLGDVIPWPGPLPNVLSIGDLLIFAGTALLLHRLCRRPGLASPAPASVAD